MSFLSDLIRFESGGKNVTNINQTTSSGRARGLYQITDGTWQDFGRRAGVDFAKYPTALSAPPELQARVAGMIPLKRWDPITLRRLSAAGHTFDVNKTLAENAAMHGETMTGKASQLVPGTSEVIPPEQLSSTKSPAFAGAEAGASVGAPASAPDAGGGLASVFGDALGGMSMGGSADGGLGTSGEMGSSPLPGSASLQTDVTTPLAQPLEQPWDALQNQKPGTLADVFALPTIGQPKMKPENIAAKSWI